MNWMSATKWEVARALVWFFVIGAAVLSTDMASISPSVLGGTKPPCEANVATASCVPQPGGFCPNFYNFCDYAVGEYGNRIDCDNSSSSCAPSGGVSCQPQADTFLHANGDCKTSS